MVKNFFHIKYLALASIIGASSLSSGESADSCSVNNFKNLNNFTSEKHYVTKDDSSSFSLEARVNSLDSVFLRAEKVFEKAKIPVLMFHNIHEKEDRYTISPDNFRKLLKELHDDNFYSVGLKSFYSGDFSDVPVGKKPVLLTFDDAGTGQFVMRSDSSICSDSAIGILEEFYDTHDFGEGGVMFISYGLNNKFKLPFDQENFASKKLKYLVNNGYDVGYHTVFHPDNTNATMNNIFEQYFLSTASMNKLLGEELFNSLEITSYAHPFGASPVNDNVFDYMCEKYDIIFDAWGGASKHPLSSNFDPHKIPRIEITYHTKDLVLDSHNFYVVTPDTKKYYEINNLIFDNFLIPSVYKLNIPSLRVDKLKNGEELSEPFVFF